MNQPKVSTPVFINETRRNGVQGSAEFDQIHLELLGWAEHRFGQLEADLDQISQPGEPRWATDINVSAHLPEPRVRKPETLTSKLLPTSHPSTTAVDVLLDIYDDARRSLEIVKTTLDERGIKPRTALVGGVVALSLVAGLESGILYGAYNGRNSIEADSSEFAGGLRISRSQASTTIELGDTSDQIEEQSKLAVSKAINVEVEDQAVENSQLILPADVSDDQAVVAAMAYLAPDSPSAESEEDKIEKEVETPPAVQALNEALDRVDFGAERIDISEVRDAVIAMDKWYAPQDKDRMANMPEGYVKVLLPNEAVGLSVPMTVAERTADVERYTSPTLAAVDYVSAKMMQRLIADKYPNLAGAMWRLRDHQAPVHMTHNDGRQSDISSSFGYEVTQYSDGPLVDYQFSSAFNIDLTRDMFVGLGRMSDEQGPVISSILYSTATVGPEVNAVLGRNFIQNKKWHQDHGHITLQKRLAMPQWRPRLADLPWSEDQDLRIGGMAQQLSEEQRASQHQDFMEWVEDNKPSEAPPTSQPVASPEVNGDAKEMPEEFEVEELSPEASAYIDGLDLPDGHKQFLRQMVPSIVTVYRTGVKINPVVALTQTSLETGFGQDRLSPRANNYFGIKAGNKWGGDVINIDTLEEYTAGDVVTITDGFRVYPSAASSVADYARLVNTREAYADAVANYTSIEGYTNGLFNEVDESGNIIREQGEPGVLSYGTDRGYEQKIFSVIEKYGYDKLIQTQIDTGPSRTESSTPVPAESQSTTTVAPNTTSTERENPNRGGRGNKSSEQSTETVVAGDIYVDRETAMHIYEGYFRDDQSGLEAWVDGLPQVEKDGQTKYGVNINNTPEADMQGDK